VGLTNHGNQTVTYSYFESATSQNFNKRHIDIQPRGIYKGGYLTKVSNTEVTLSPFTLEIGDSSIQIGSKSSANATLNSTTLDSGGISPATPYLVFRWAYTASQSNYVEIHAIASVSAAQSNDIIIGKCVFTGATLTEFSYTDRTFLSVQDLFLKVIPNEAGGMYVWVRSGRMHTSSACVLVPEQSVGPFSVPGSPNSRIDLVYVDSDGSIKIQQGTAGVNPSTPNYSGKSVIAEVRIVNGDTSIPASRIVDVRAFMATTPEIPVEEFQSKYSTSWDFQKGVNLTPVADVWTDIDLSSKVPANTKGVVLHIHMSGTQTNIWASFRKKQSGNSPTGGAASRGTVGVVQSHFADPNLGTHDDVIVECDSNRKIQYYTDATCVSKLNALDISVKNWFM